MSKRVALICGFPARSKSTSLQNMDNVLHINCEGAAKELSFSLKGKKAFKTLTLKSPAQLPEVFAWIETQPDYHTLVIDGLNFLMDMFESQNIYQSADSRAAWGDYAQFLKNMMQTLVANCTKTVIFISHIDSVYSESEQQFNYRVPIKGALAKTGVEAFFTTILNAERVKVTKLEPYQNGLLTITPDEEEDGVKYVFQTRVTKDTVGSNIRTPIGLFERNETYIDSDLTKVIQRLNEYYAE